MASFFYSQSPNFLAAGRSSRSRDKKALTKLYLDNKQALEAAQLHSMPGHYGPNPGDKGSAKGLQDQRSLSSDPEDSQLIQLRKDFQYQQDRLYAWGIGWSETRARRGSQGGRSGPQSPLQSPEKTLSNDSGADHGQDALGDLVASIMDEIKKLLEQSGQLSHPGRHDEALNFDAGLEKEKGWGFNLNLTRQKTPPSFAADNPKLGRKDSSQSPEWKLHELTTGQALVDQLRSCIDVLYSLVDDSAGNDNGASPGDFKGMASSKLQRETPTSDFAMDASKLALMQKVHSHPLHIDFSRLQPMHDPTIDGDFFDSAVNLPPPSYDDAQQLSSPRARSIYFYAHAQAHVVVDLVSVNPVNLPALLALGEETTALGPFQELYTLAQKLSGDGLLSWDGHMKVLGFTLAGSKHASKFGLVYALPAPIDPTALQSYQTLTSTFLNASSSGYGQDETSIPPLENKFRLAYNITLLVAGYLAHGSTHGHIRSSNVLFLKETENSRNLGAALRSPYLLQPVQALVGLDTDSLSGVPASEAIYHYPDADALGYGTLAAHDIYSVGLLLLEVGMWLPLRRFWKPKYEQDRTIFVDRLRRTYAPKVASKCGSRYMKIVQRCLNAPIELADKPDLTDAAEFLLEILKELSQCCALDEAGTPSPLDIDIIEALIDDTKVNSPAKLAAANAAKQKEVEKQLPPLPAEAEQITQSKRGGPSSKRRNAAAQPALRKFPDMPIPQDKLNTWNSVLLPKLQKVLTRALADSPESASANLMMIGPSPDKAMTTIVIQCSDTGRVHEELKTRLKGKLGIGRGWGLVVVKGDIRRSGHRTDVARRAKAPRRSKHDGRDKLVQPEPPMPQRVYQKQPTSGASIGAFKDGEHLPPVSLGGTVLVDGKPFVMSVHHMLDNVSDRGSDDEDTDMDVDERHANDTFPQDDCAQRSSLWGQGPMMELDAMGSHMGPDLLPSSAKLDFSDDDGLGDDFQLYDSDSESDASTIRPDYSMFDDDGNEYWFMDDDEVPELDDDQLSDASSSDESIESVGDKPGFSLDMGAFDDDEVCVTQPALDDVDEDFFPNDEDRDDDHLDSHTLGAVHASSGIRRKVYDNMKHEIDWALIRVNDERSDFERRRSKSKRSTRLGASDGAHLTSIAPLSSLPNTHVVTVGRTSGRAHGKISQAMSLIKFYGRTSFSSSYTIEGGFGVPGDSGAWVWNEEKGELCGHVLAWADGLKVAFLGPMEVMVEDMKDKLGAERVELMGTFMERERDFFRELKTIKSNVQSSSRSNDSERDRRVMMNERLDRTREIENAIKRMSLDSSASASNVSRSRDNSGDTFQSHSSRCSSASSGYGSRDGDGRPRKDRFDLHLPGPGGQDVMQQIPMAQAFT